MTMSHMMGWQTLYTGIRNCVSPLGAVYRMRLDRHEESAHCVMSGTSHAHATNTNINRHALRRRKSAWLFPDWRGDG